MAAKLPSERAEQLYSFARFLLAESRFAMDEDDPTDVELEAEDALWDAAMIRHADKFEALKAQAITDIAARNISSMFDERGEFTIE